MRQPRSHNLKDQRDTRMWKMDNGWGCYRMSLVFSLEGSFPNGLDLQFEGRNDRFGEIFKLLPDAIPGTEIDRMEILVGGRLGGIPHVANTKEYLIGVQGEVQIHVGREKYVVKAGDVFAFPGDQPHSYQNIGKTKAVCFGVVILLHSPH